MSVVIHEVAHGYAALWQGDVMAKYAGRLTLNPIKHLDPIGSVILPAMMALFGGIIFGWAKPVPFNPHNLKDKRWGELYVAVAGPLSNIFLAIVFSILIRVAGAFNLPNSLVEISLLVVLINVVLAFFNLIPIPPLDGSKILFNLFPKFFYKIRHTLESFGFIGILIFVFILWQFLFPVVLLITELLTGINLI